MHQPIPERPMVPHWVTSHINNVRGISPAARAQLHETVATWLTHDILVLSNPDTLTPEQQAQSLSHAPASRVLAPALRFFEQPAAMQQGILYAENVDRLLCEQPLSPQSVKEALGVSQATQVRKLARRALHAMMYPETVYVSPVQAIEEEVVMRCMGCTVTREQAKVGGAVSAHGMASCSGLSVPVTRAVLRRLATRDEPLVDEVAMRGQLGFTITEAGMALQGRVLSDCKDLRFLWMPPSQPAPQEPQRAASRSVALPPYSPPLFEPRSAPARFIAWYCQDKEATVRDKLTAVVRQALDSGYIALRENRPGQSKPYPDAPQHNRRYVAVGRALQNESEPAQRALLYSLGLHTLVYGKPSNGAEIHEALGLLPGDSLQAFARLVKYKVARQATGPAEGSFDK